MARPFSLFGTVTRALHSAGRTALVEGEWCCRSGLSPRKACCSLGVTSGFARTQNRRPNSGQDVEDTCPLGGVPDRDVVGVAGAAPARPVNHQPALALKLLDAADDGALAAAECRGDDVLRVSAAVPLSEGARVQPRVEAVLGGHADRRFLRRSRAVLAALMAMAAWSRVMPRPVYGSCRRRCKAARYLAWAFVMPVVRLRGVVSRRFAFSQSRRVMLRAPTARQSRSRTTDTPHRSGS